MEPLLSVQDCCFAYTEGDFTLEDVSVAVGGGEMLGVVGPNGSGKSTLLRIMAGILRQSTGQVLLEGRPIGALSRRRLAREQAFLPQSPSSSFQFTVREVVALGRYPYQGTFGLLRPQDLAAIEEALLETDASGLAERYFSSLSGGEKQRVLLASVLAQRPRVLLLDEPAASLDIHHTSHIFDLLWQLSRAGMGVVVVTHDLNNAAQFCDRLVLLQDGRVAQAGPPGRVMREDTISGVYETPVRVLPHPATHLPMVLVLGKKTADESK